MSLRTVFSTAVGNIFTALGDIPVSATYRRTATVYDPATGNNTSTNTDTTVTAIFVRFNEQEIARSVGIQVTDIKCLVKVTSLASAPSIQLDTIINGGNTYSIVNFTTDPAGAMYIFQLRAP